MRRRACGGTGNVGYAAASHDLAPDPTRAFVPAGKLNAALPAARQKRPRSPTTTTVWSWTMLWSRAATQLVPAIGRVIQRAGKTPRTVTADCSYGEKAVEDDLLALGVRHVVIPRKGKPGKARRAAEHWPAFRKAVKWRTGCEGRVSALKRQYGWDRTRLDGTEGARTWTGYGILAHNLVKISILAG